MPHLEVEHVLNQPDVETPYGLRDRAIMETFYSTGMRRRELAATHPGASLEPRGSVGQGQR